VSSSGLAEPRSLPPGQRLEPVLRTVHYGSVPRIDLATWSLRIGGDTLDGEALSLSWADFASLPQTVVRADHHCVSRYTTLDLSWSGVAARTVIEMAPRPMASSMSWSRLRGGTAPTSGSRVFATHLDGVPLTPEHGWPVRLVLPHLYGWKGPKWVGAIDYQRYPARGFWEQRGYHFTGDVWRDERYSYQE
jgi:DMSO/TMAO reductase YedYZ molybdopterin-dependent catalytic subunit